jgi:hypothetical protein
MIRRLGETRNGGMDEQKKNIWGIYRQENKKFWEELIAYFT